MLPAALGSGHKGYGCDVTDSRQLAAAARQERFGGAEALPSDEAAQMAGLFATYGQDPELIAKICPRRSYQPQGWQEGRR
jgi:hypothetical protein